jgi:hypothetical protein
VTGDHVRRDCDRLRGNITDLCAVSRPYGAPLLNLHLRVELMVLDDNDHDHGIAATTLTPLTDIATSRTMLRSVTSMGFAHDDSITIDERDWFSNDRIRCISLLTSLLHLSLDFGIDADILLLFSIDLRHLRHLRLLSIDPVLRTDDRGRDALLRDPAAGTELDSMTPSSSSDSSSSSSQTSASASFSSHHLRRLPSIQFPSLTNIEIRRSTPYGLSFLLDHPLVTTLTLGRMRPSQTWGSSQTQQFECDGVDILRLLQQYRSLSELSLVGFSFDSAMLNHWLRQDPSTSRSLLVHWFLLFWFMFLVFVSYPICLSI